MYVTNRAFICRREKWNYNKVKWSSNDLAGFAYPRSQRPLYLFPLLEVNYKTPSLNFVLNHFIAADFPFFFLFLIHKLVPCISSTSRKIHCGLTIATSVINKNSLWSIFCFPYIYIYFMVIYRVYFYRRCTRITR